MNEIIDRDLLKKIIEDKKITQSDLAKELGTTKQYISLVLNEKSKIGSNVKDRIKTAFPEYFNGSKNNLVKIKYLPEVSLSAGYGTTVYDEKCETVIIDKKLLLTEKGLAINPKYCKIVTVSGDSMLPEYHNGDRVIIDESINTFIDGHVFAFRFNGQCYIKMINVLPDRIKCIPLNDKYDTFYLSKNDDFTVFGMIIPRIRL